MNMRFSAIRSLVSSMILIGSNGHRRVLISLYESLQFPIPPLSVQQKLVKEIKMLETPNATAQNVIDNAAAEKQGILKMWLV